jgi:hypothetical protein
MKRKLLLCTLLVLAGIAVLVVSPVGPTSSQAHPAIAPLAGDDESLIKRGFEISPVELNLKGKNRALVGLGSYIVNTGGCNDCHTNPSYLPGHDPFLGEEEQINVPCFLSGGTPFGPGLSSRNLTPDPDGLPGGLTLEMFFKTLRTGEDQNNPGTGDLLQVMPWPVFGKKTDRELTAVYEYLSAIPPRSRCAP